MSGVNNIQTRIIEDRSALLHHIIRCLGALYRTEPIFSDHEIEWETSAGVVMLLGENPASSSKGSEPCVVLNKRSPKVRQPGDLCFPGGSMAPRVDPYLARVFSLPFTSLDRWRYWGSGKQTQGKPAKTLSILWTTGLRESFEEMRLNPFGVRFLGPLPPQSLVMFKRTIYPMVGWIKRQKRFFPNWEVAKIVYLPLKDLLNPQYYARYRLRMGNNPGQGPAGIIQEYPCFRLPSPGNQEILWGATYRITLGFLKLVFGFEPPDSTNLPVVEGVLDDTYLTGHR